jgi:PAT family beta-lactamase induction signal transducer AmpG
MGYDEWHRGAALATVAIFTTVGGTIIGGSLTQMMGLGHALWVFGVVQILSNIGYILVAQSAEPNLVLMYGAMGFEQFTQGLGTGAFGVLLLRLTQKRFSATQFALFSSLFGIPRTLAGPVSGFLVYSLGWPTFFWVTIFAGIPGLLLLQRFVPLGVREPVFSVSERPPAGPLTRRKLVTTIVAAALVAFLIGYLTLALMNALTNFKNAPKYGFQYGGALEALSEPASISDWWMLVAVLTFALVSGLFAAAIVAARHGAAPPPEEESGAAPPPDLD